MLLRKKLSDTTDPVYITIALVGSVASIIGLLYVFSPGHTIDQGAKLESSPGSAVYQAGRDIVIQQQPPTAKAMAPPQKAHTSPIRENAQVDEPVKQTLDSDRKQQIGKTHFDVIGGTTEERSTIKKRLDDLNVKAATINIVKSERDNSRNVYIEVTYQDNTIFTDSFNTPLENAANLIISEIDGNRRRR